ncbi:MAG: Uma2 family endonuclease [Cyanobacteria bacterium J06648_16]
MVLLPEHPTQILPLVNGDHLTQAEFERRYAAMPHIKKAELIEGVVYMPAALRYRQHGQPHSDVVLWLGTYAAATPGIEVADNPTVRLDLDNDPQPDALLRIDEAGGGQSRISEDDYVEGAPELIVEIAASSAAYDLHEKKNAYRRNGVREYIVWQVADRQISWFRLEAGTYKLISPDNDGIIHSAVFPGLALDVESLLSHDLMAVIETVRNCFGSEAHQAFIARLAQR